MPTSRRVNIALFAFGTTIAACHSGGGTNTIAQTECKFARSPGWVNEVVQAAVPSNLLVCPMVLRQGNTRFTSSGFVDVLLSKHNGPAGFIGIAELWSVRLGGGRADSLQTPNNEFAFIDPAPYLSNNEQPIRGQFNVAWIAAIKGPSGQQESDSLSVVYPTQIEYNGFFVAAANVVTPIVVSSVPGNITGDVFMYPGQLGNWRIVTDWDTTGYRFQWSVDGNAASGATDALFSQSFSTVGVHTLRVDETLADNSVISTSKQVTVNLVAYIAGPILASPTHSAHYDASAPGGFAPYTYQWTWDDLAVGSGASLDIWPGSPSTSHTAGLTVTDAQGHVATVTLGVFVLANDNGCLQEPCP